ncbi:MAG TPA: hypothetical protein VFH66_09200 [Mycobacteriales bacterium]|nr:hypothetical protein [Mycobacteriales bacterium]
MTSVRAHGVTVRTMDGWEARISRRPPTEPEERTHSVTHIANFPLPARRGDFGSGAVERMGRDDVLVVLVEFDSDSAKTALFARRGLPRPRVVDFDPRKLQRTLPGQSGGQWFFNTGGRAFTLYVVLGSHHRRARLLPQVHAVLDHLTID